MISKTISHYVILNQLGVGGMGEVYLAEDTKLNRKVALKVIKGASEADELAKKRLIREAHAAARLDHPNICAIHEVGEWNGESFIVMQYVEGETLADRIVRKPFDLAESVDVAVQVADALSEAHSQGIVHRDIKPQNIMLTMRGQVKVMDFGLARLAQRESGIDSGVDTKSILTEPGVLVGTVPYLSPEQVRGDVADGRSDIFSFGAMLYKMITGRHPFAGDNDGATIAAILTVDPPPLARYATNVPNELERIQHKCLEKDRERRYQSARELLVDLRSLQRGLDSSTVTIEAVPLRQSKIRRLGILSLVAIAALIGVRLYLLAIEDKASGKDIASVAVLPFVNVGADANTEYLSDGITDGLIDSLSQLPNMKVTARTSVFRYKSRETDASAVGRDLKVQAVLTGRVALHGDTLSISAELADARDNSHIWGEQYNRKLSNLFLLQGEISRDISDKLELRLSGENQRRLTKLHTQNSEAYQLYLKGRYFWNKRTIEDTTKGIEYFNQAIEIDSNYALAYAGLADSYSRLGSAGYDTVPPREIMPKAKEAALKALKLDETLAEAHTSLGIINLQYDWDWIGAAKEFQRSLELNPSYPTAHYWYSLYLIAMGSRDESIAESKVALELDPASPSAGVNIARAFYFARKYDEALEQCRKALEMDKNYIRAHYFIGLAQEQKRNHRQAIEAFQKVMTLDQESSSAVAALGIAFAFAGNRPEAMKRIAELRKRAKQTYLSPIYEAFIYAVLGDSDQAFERLEKTYAERSSALAYAKVEPALDRLRSDKRFTDLLLRIGHTP